MIADGIGFHTTVTNGLQSDKHEPMVSTDEPRGKAILHELQSANE